MWALADARPFAESSDRLIWPWLVEPRRLWSLLEMERHLAGNWLATVSTLDRMRWLLVAAFKSPQATEEFRKARDSSEAWIKEEIRALPFSSSLKLQVERVFIALREAGTDDPHDGQRAITMLDEIGYNIQEELKAHLFLVVPESRKRWFDEDDTALFGSAVSDAFPDSTPEIAEAGRCFALARWTASVFHLMRALELALHKWARELGPTQFAAIELENWKNILDVVEKRVKALEQEPKSTQKDAELKYYGETLAHFRAVKDAWRNHVAHARERYDEGRATSIMSHTREFMRLLASRP